MAESHGGFDSIAAIPTESLRETLRRTMVMGLPQEDAEKPTFYFERVVTWEDHDSEDQPWDWDDAPTVDTQQSAVQPVCAYEFFSPLGRQGAYYTEVGEFNPTTLVITLFEDEFNEVRGASHVTVGPSTMRWHFRYFRPAQGLNDLTVYQVTFASDMETI